MKRTPSQRWQDEIIARAREYREAEQRALEAIIKEHKGANARETTMAMARTIREMRINFRALGEAVEPIVQNERGRIMWFSAGGHRGAERGQNGS
jgi:hypothetical protein